MFLLVLLCAALCRSAVFQASENPVPDSYIAQFSRGITTQVARAVTAKYSGAQYVQIGEYRALLVRLTDESRLRQLLEESGVESVHQDSFASVASTQQNPPWGLDRIDQPALPLTSSFTYPSNGGEGQRVYVIDTGININHNDFEGRAIWGANFVDGEGDFDGNGHGTHCAGTIAGTTYGVAKRATVVAVKVGDSLGFINISSAIKGVEWVTEQCASNFKVCTISMSFGMLGFGMTATLTDAVSAAIKLGVVAVAAAGNYGGWVSCFISPANTPDAITVGATNKTDFRAEISSYGSCVDIFAPGVDILSAWIGSNNATNLETGTSMAAPHVAGAVAVLKSSYGFADASPAEIRAELLRNAVPSVQDSGSNTTNLLLRLRPQLFVCGESIPPGEASTEIRVVESGQYKNNQRCTWLVRSTLQGGRISAAFDSFNTQFGFDYVQIYDGNSTATVGLLPNNANASLSVSGWTGSAPPKPKSVSTTGSEMLILFQSDATVRGSGFSLQVTEFSECACGETLPNLGNGTGEASFIRIKPLLSEGYRSGMNCTWTTKVRSGCNIKVNFESFSLTETDFVWVYNGPSVASPTLVFASGNTVPAAVSTTGTEVAVVFTSDSASTQNGFSIKLKPVCKSVSAPEVAATADTSKQNIDESAKIGIGVGAGCFVALVLALLEGQKYVRRRRVSPTQI